MNSYRSFALSIFALAVCASPLVAADDKEAPVPAPKQRSAAEQKEVDEKRMRIAEKKKGLNGSSWSVTLYPTTDKKLKNLTDTIIFQDGQVRFKSFADKGYTPTNYTISVGSKDSELAVWETMQASKGGHLFARGEWEKDTMSGSVSEQLEEGKINNEYYFSSAPRKEIPAESTKKEGVSADIKEGSPAELPKALVSEENKE